MSNLIICIPQQTLLLGANQEAWNESVL